MATMTPTRQYSKPSREKVARVKLRPTVAVGTPMQPAPVAAPPAGQQQVPEPILGVGANTGIVHFTAGDSPDGPEQINIQPPMSGTIARAPQLIPGVPSYAEGGTVTAGDPNVWDDNQKMWIDSSTGNRMRPVDQGGDGLWRNQQGQTYDPNTGQWSGGAAAPAATGDPLQAQLDQRRGTIAAQQGAINAGAGVIQANTGVIDARQASMPARQGVIDASGRVLDARAGTLPAQQSVINAQRGVVGAEADYINANRGYINFAQTQNNRRLAETQGVIAAQQNVPDLTATARAQTTYNDQLYKNQIAGVTDATLVDLPNGTGELLAPGVRGRIMTQAQLLETKMKNNEAIRGIVLEQARLALQLQGTNVDEARNAAAAAGLTLDEAQMVVQRAEIDAARAGLTLDQYQLAVNQAEINADRAGLTQDTANLGVRQSQLREEELGLPPRAGMKLYTDPVSGQSSWMSPAEADTRNTMYQNRGLLTTDPSTGQLVPAELGALSDSQIATAAGEGIMPREKAMAELTRRGYSPAAADYMIQLGTPQDGGGFDESDLNGPAPSATTPSQTTPAAPQPVQSRTMIPNLYESSLAKLRSSNEGITIQR